MLREKAMTRSIVNFKAAMHALKCSEVHGNALLRACRSKRTQFPPASRGTKYERSHTAGDRVRQMRHCGKTNPSIVQLQEHQAVARRLPRLRRTRVPRWSRPSALVPRRGVSATIPLMPILSPAQLAVLLTIGLCIGVLSSMLGIGGGVLVIPILTGIFLFSQKQAVGTSLAMLLPPIGLFAGLAAYRAGNVSVPAAGRLGGGVFIWGGWGGGVAAAPAGGW